jgi:hypothetical protein
MEIEKYMPSKTAKKAAVPALILVLANIIVSLIKQAGIEIDDGVLWQSVFGGYGASIAFINYIKNHKRGKAASG